MIYKSVLIVPAESDFWREISDEQCMLCLKCSLEQLREQKKVILDIFTFATRPLGLCLDLKRQAFGDHTLLEDAVNFITLITFTFRYLQFEGSPLVCILKDEVSEKKLIENSVFLINQFLKEQGNEDVKCCVLSEDIDEKDVEAAEAFHVNEISSMSEAHLEKTLNAYYDPSPAINALLFFEVASKKEVNIVIEKLNKAENEFSRNHSFLYKKMIEIQDLLNERNRLLAENEALAFMHANSEHSLNHLRKDAEIIVDWYKKENAGIKEWYNREYEALPLWYKRFGHVLKRALKSFR